MASWRDRVVSLVAFSLGVSAFDAGPTIDPSPPATAAVEEAAPEGLHPRKPNKRRPRISPLPVSLTRWYQADIEAATHLASQGDLSRCSQLYRSFGRDGQIQGLLGTRTGGLVRLPKRFKGTPAAVAKLEGCDGEPGLFARIFPAAELSKMAADGEVLGVAIGEFVQTEGSEYPVLTRLDPEFLTYRWTEDRWYYRSVEGLIPITPGDGRWVLHLPHGKHEPWNHGSWQALARAFVSKEHAFMMRENYNAKLANPARVAVSPQGASEEQKQSWFQKVMAWGVNSVFGLMPGYDIRLLELKGEGFRVFQETIGTCDTEFMISICGQIVTVTGGAGFANANIHATIRTDLIQGDGDALAETLNEQAIPRVLQSYVGANETCELSWDTRPPADMKAGAESLSATAKAIEDCDRALAKHGLELDVQAVTARFAMPVRARRASSEPPMQEAA